MLTAFGDESGVHDGSPVAIWGGYIAPAKTWAAFRRDWNSRLSQDGLDHFHMSVFKADRPPFHRLSRAGHNLLERDMSELIASYSLGGVIAGLHRPGWDGSASAFVKEEFGDSVRFGFHISIREFVKFRSANFPDETVELIYGSGSLEKKVADLSDSFVAAQDAYAERLVGISFRSMKREPGIQAADMLIWEFYSQFKRALGGTGRFDVISGTTLDRLCRGGVSIRMYGSDAANYLNLTCVSY